MKRIILRSTITILTLWPCTELLAHRAKLHTSELSSKSGDLSTQQMQKRVTHAKELLGSGYNKSYVRSAEQIKKINRKIYLKTKEALPQAFKKQYQRIAQTIIDVSFQHDLDPVFVMAVIQSESSFNPTMIGGVGEIGLMQIRPTTAEWICQKLGIKYKGEKSLRDPKVNIQIGTAYFGYLRSKFKSHAQLYIAAYNMGQGNVKVALEKDVWPKDYPMHVMKNYLGFYEEFIPTRTVAARKVATNN